MNVLETGDCVLVAQALFVHVTKKAYGVGD